MSMAFGGSSNLEEARDPQVEPAGGNGGPWNTRKLGLAACGGFALLSVVTLAIGLKGFGGGEHASPPNASVVVETCPGLHAGTPVGSTQEAPTPQAYDAALKALDLESVKADVKQLLTDSQACWPADYGNYGPFFVRLAWHCSGTFRKGDGKGGCGGGRQRFEPEASWDDNTNLDKARALLAPIKAKYGVGLSWGDLFVLAGTTALRNMGAPIKTFCAGRNDDADGAESVALGPSPVQEQKAPCAGQTNGRCQDKPSDTVLGTTTLGLIYVNPEGPIDPATSKPIPDPALSAKEVRITFEKMGHDDRSTVALIGGGHAFGKTHGACSVEGAAGMPPKDAYPAKVAPWQGKCGNGKGGNTSTSGFEGPWTSTPTQWSNEYFKYLLDHEWEKHVGPGGHWQWRLKDSPDDKRMRLTADLALIHDEKYKKIVEEFASDMSSLDAAFDQAWTDLTTKGGSWSPEKKCDSGEAKVDAASLVRMLSSDSP